MSASVLGGTNKELGSQQWIRDRTIPLYVQLAPVQPAITHCQATYSSTSKIWKDTEAAANLPIGEMGSQSSQRRLQDCGEPQSEREALWALSGGRLWGLSWHMGTPHVRGRLSPRGPTRGPIETRSQMRKTLRLQFFDSCLMSRRHCTRGRRATKSKSSQRAILCSTLINVKRCALSQMLLICMSPHFKRCHAG